MRVLIDKQDVIDTVCKACSMEEDYHKCDGYPETSTWCDELVALRALPSTESEIIRCKDCVYYDWDCVDMPYGMSGMIRWCDLHYDAENENLAVNPDDYCKWAKRRVNGTD